jgi:hypothetical protein
MNFIRMTCILSCQFTLLCIYGSIVLKVHKNHLCVFCKHTALSSLQVMDGKYF